MIIKVTGDPSIMNRVKGKGDVIWTVGNNTKLGMPQQISNLTRNLAIDHLPGPLFGGYLTMHRTTGPGQPPGDPLPLTSPPTALGLSNGSWVYIRQLQPLPEPGGVGFPGVSPGFAFGGSDDGASFPGVTRTESHETGGGSGFNPTDHETQMKMARLNELAERLAELPNDRIRQLLNLDFEEEEEAYDGMDDTMPQFPRGHPTPAQAQEAAEMGESIYDDYADDGFGPPSRATTESWGEGGGYRRKAKRKGREQRGRRRDGGSSGRTHTRYFSSFIGEWERQTEALGVDRLARGLCHSALARLARRQNEDLRRYDSLSEIMQISSRRGDTDSWGAAGRW